MAGAAIENPPAREFGEYPGVRFYVFADASTTMSVGGSWVSAIFDSLPAAMSWVGYDLDAEVAFRANGRSPIGRRP